MQQLRRFGWDEGVAARYGDVVPTSAVDAGGRAGDGWSTQPGRVTCVHRINCDVITADGERVARPGSQLVEAEGSSLPAAGDWVVLRDPEDDDDDELLIEALVPRWSAISRRDPADRATEQVLAADVDVVFLVHSLDQELNLRRIERSLVLAHASGAEPVVVLTKCDTIDRPSKVADKVRGVALDAPLAVTSAITGEGIDTLRTHARPNRTVALIGASGAGKSSLINELVGQPIQATGEVRDGDAKGRHTTTQRELIPLPGGGVLIDTPGLRGLGLWEAEDGVALAFADIDELAETCKFRDCAHETEPGCAVKAAIDNGKLDARRLDSYRRLVGEMADLSRRQEEQSRKQRKGRPSPIPSDEREW